jgi:hypothetical protein
MSVLTVTWGTCSASAGQSGEMRAGSRWQSAKALRRRSSSALATRFPGRVGRFWTPRLETAELYKVSGLRVLARSAESAESHPPYLSVPPPLEVYRERGHRRLASRTFASKCATCCWGAEMAVEMIIDQWNPSVRRYRRETFCYGPRSCRFYAAGPTRKVPGRKGMSWEEEDWVDEEATSHRGSD